MQAGPPSATTPIERLRQRLADWIRRLAAEMDPDLPSAIVPAEMSGTLIDEPVDRYMQAGRPRPDFVRRDDENFDGA